MPMQAAAAHHTMLPACQRQKGPACTVTCPPACKLALSSLRMQLEMPYSQSMACRLCAMSVRFWSPLYNVHRLQHNDISTPPPDEQGCIALTPLALFMQTPHKYFACVCTKHISGQLLDAHHEAMLDFCRCRLYDGACSEQRAWPFSGVWHLHCKALSLQVFHGQLTI